MKRFFNWLLTIFRPNTKNYVKNIQEDKSPVSSGAGYAKSKRKRYSNNLLAWSFPKDILENEKDNQGVSVSIRMKADSSFKTIDFSDKPLVNSAKKGLSAVTHTLEFTINPLDESTKKLIEEAKNKKPICFIFRSVYGDIYLLGEKNGLELKDLDGSKIKFSGEETDVFFHVAEECLNVLLPNIEK